jgi:hypothetical protein
LIQDGTTGELFAKAPVTTATAVEPVIDSSRYFVIRIVDTQTNQSAFVGLGFSERGLAFDMNVAIQDHFNRLNSGTVKKEEDNFHVDYTLKEGQTFKISLKAKQDNAVNDAGKVKDSHRAEFDTFGDFQTSSTSEWTSFD